jgi:transcriptional regulator with XRE-family HTH domain
MPGHFALLGAAIAAIRKGYNLRQWEFAERLGVSLVTIRMWEQGLKKPGVESLLKLADIAPAQLTWEILKHIGIRPERARAWLPRGGRAEGSLGGPELRLVTPQNWKRFSAAGKTEKIYDVLPLFRNPAAAALATDVREEDIEGWAVVHHSMNRGHQPQNIVCIRLRNGSLDPVVPEGSIAGVDISRRQVSRTEPELALVKVEDLVMVKLVRALPSGYLELTAYNSNSCPPRKYSPKRAEVRGQVIWWWALAREGEMRTEI